LVVTFNRTLRGYVADLAEEQMAGKDNLELEVSTFGKWAQTMLPDCMIVNDAWRRNKLEELCEGFPLETDFLTGEVDYVLGRFLPDQLSNYLDCTRDGRGASPRIDRGLRKRILTEILDPYTEWKKCLESFDWNDLATMLVNLPPRTCYDVIIADESQDFSANEVRAILRCAANPSSITFVLDAAQRIYPRGFTWREAGVTIQGAHSYRLAKNHRNTVEICRFAQPLLEGVEIGDDGTFPDFNSCTRHGDKPIVLRGKYSGQARYAIQYIQSRVDLANESVAFLKPKGGDWFKTIKGSLSASGFHYIEMTRIPEWPQGNENIALCTMNSAKGLEFDHVIVLGLNQEVTEHGPEPEDSTLGNLRRLLAMAVTRARMSVIIGYKPMEASDLVGYFKDGTFREVEV
jgi:superfamily I DNA/RNA helicase